MMVGTVDYIRADEDGASGPTGDEFLEAVLPGATIRALAFPSTHRVPSVVRGTANFRPSFPPSDLIVVNASGSLASPEPAQSASVDAVRTLRAARPDVPIIALFVRCSLEKAACHDFDEPATLRFKYMTKAVDTASVLMLASGATDYVIVDDASSPAACELLRHRLGLHLRARTALQGSFGQKTALAAEDPFRTPWAALYDAESGRLDAQRIADALGAKLKPLVEALSLHYSAVHRAPSAPAYQAALRPVARMLEMVHDSLPEEATRRAWLNRPRADLEDASPIEVVLSGEVGAVVSLLEGAQLGVGS